MREKEEAAASKKQKQAAIYEILTPSGPSPIKSAELFMKDSQKSRPTELENYFYTCSLRNATLQCVFSQVISVS